MTTRHRTPRERAATAAAQAAVARVTARAATAAAVDWPELTAPYPITPAIARDIRQHIERTPR